MFRIRKLLPLKLKENAVLLSSDSLLEATEDVTIHRADPVCLGGEEGEEEGCEESDYDTDDEFANSNDWKDVVSGDKLSHDQSPDNSFDLSLIAFCNEDSNRGPVIRGGEQPLIDLSFDENTPEMKKRGSLESLTDNTGPSVDDVDGGTIIQHFQMSPKPKRRKMDESETVISNSSLDNDGGCSNTICSFTQANGKSRPTSTDPSIDSSSLCLRASVSPVSIIDLTQSSCSENGRHSSTPDSVIITAITNDTSKSASLQVSDELHFDLTLPVVRHAHRGSTPLGSPGPVSPQSSLGSPSFLPPTPGRTNNSRSILGNKRSLGFL